MSEQATKSSSRAAKKTYYCSFCGKSQHEVRKLVAGPTAFICDECVDLCEDIITDGSVGQQSNDMYRLSISKRQLAMLAEKNVTLGNVLGREFGDATSVSEVALSQILNAIGRVVVQELGSTDEHLAKIVESNARLEAARSELGEEAEAVRELDRENMSIWKESTPPIVRLLATI